MDDPRTPVWKVPRRQRNNARALRKNLTDTERLLWFELRDHRLIGASFRRQVPIDRYIADFVCHAAALIIELDGGQHYSDEGERSDALRTSALEALGYRVLRFSNTDVIGNREGVLDVIAAVIAERAPTPTLPRKRERGR
ncbi:MAG: endonuclease domain-containing protein [Bradyrhizobiaceae bacterium]|nr:MAG: endonuclease domain-containing protein [Bradyrhizobiaceae bacterium]